MLVYSLNSRSNTPNLVRKNHLYEIRVVNLVPMYIHSLQQLVNLLIRKLLSKWGKNCPHSYTLAISHSISVITKTSSFGFPPPLPLSFRNGTKQTIAQLSDTNITRQVLIKHLEPTHKLIRFARVTEAVGTVEDLKEWFKVHCILISYLYSTGKNGEELTVSLGGRVVDQVFNFSVGRVLTAGAEEITEWGERDTAITALVEEGEGFFVVCGCLYVGVLG